MIVTPSALCVCRALCENEIPGKRYTCHFEDSWQQNFHSSFEVRIRSWSALALPRSSAVIPKQQPANSLPETSAVSVEAKQAVTRTMLLDDAAASCPAARYLHQSCSCCGPSLVLRVDSKMGNLSLEILSHSSCAPSS